MTEYLFWCEISLKLNANLILPAAVIINEAGGGGGGVSNLSGPVLILFPGSFRR